MYKSLQIEYLFKSKKKRTAAIVPATIRPESFIQAKQPSRKRKMKIKKVPRKGHFVSARKLLSLSAPIMNHGTKLKRITLAVEYELVDRPANDPSKIAIMNRID